VDRLLIFSKNGVRVCKRQTDVLHRTGTESIKIKEFLNLFSFFLFLDQDITNPSTVTPTIFYNLLLHIQWGI